MNIKLYNIDNDDVKKYANKYNLDVVDITSKYNTRYKKYVKQIL